MQYQYVLPGLVALAVTLSLGCAKPRTLEEIEADQRALPVLYLTEETGNRVEASADAGLFVEEETGELAYRAYECQNPDCPGRAGDDQPHLFIHRDVLAKIDANGEVVWEPVPAGQNPQEYIRTQGGFLEPTCPKCAEQRNLETESEEDRQKYRDWVKLHELPKTAARRAELEEEYQAAFEARERVRQGE